MSRIPEIPIVDLADLLSRENRERAVSAVRQGFSAYGLVYLQNHGIDPEALERFYSVYQAFSAREESAKRALAGADIWYQRGFTPANTEQAVAASGQPDFKECYFATPTECAPSDQRRYPEILADNIWPEDLPEFRDAYLALGRALHQAGARLLEACALALGLAEDTFTTRLPGAAHVTRALRYLPLRPEQVGTGVLWGEEHTDFNLLTLLPGGRFIDPSGRPCAKPDSNSGLFLRTRATAHAPGGVRVAGTPKPGCIVAQVGQQLEILSGGTFLATPHEVTPPLTPGYSRLSMAHFIHVHPDTVLSPIGPLATPDAIDAYSPPVLAGTYAIKTLVDIGLAPKSALDCLGYRHYDRLDQARRTEK